MSRALAYLGIVAVLSLIGCGVVVSKPTPSVSATLLRQITVGGVGLAVELADSEASRQQGLSGRTSLPEGQGMLFVFPGPGVYEFWMNEMRFSLDLVWIRNGVVVQLSSDIPAPSPAHPTLARLSPGQEVDRVLEVPAGWVAAHNINLGAKVAGL